MVKMLRQALESKYIFGAELVLDKKYAGKSFAITPFATVVNKDSEVVSADKATTVEIGSSAAPGFDVDGGVEE